MACIADAVCPICKEYLVFNGENRYYCFKCKKVFAFMVIEEEK